MSNYTGGVKNRQKRALARLREQLVSKVKNGKELHAKEPNGFHYVSTVLPLEEADVKRIKKEIATLEAKV